MTASLHSKLNALVAQRRRIAIRQEIAPEAYAISFYLGRANEEGDLVYQGRGITVKSHTKDGIARVWVICNGGIAFDASVQFGYSENTGAGLLAQELSLFYEADAIVSFDLGAGSTSWFSQFKEAAREARLAHDQVRRYGGESELEQAQIVQLSRCWGIDLTRLDQLDAALAA
jgi:hypothetical protein